MKNSADGEMGEVVDLLNPFDNKVANLAKQILKETKSIKNFFMLKQHLLTTTTLKDDIFSAATFLKLSS